MISQEWQQIETGSFQAFQISKTNLRVYYHQFKYDYLHIIASICRLKTSAPTEISSNHPGFDSANQWFTFQLNIRVEYPVFQCHNLTFERLDKDKNGQELKSDDSAKKFQIKLIHDIFGFR